MVWQIMPATSRWGHVRTGVGRDPSGLFTGSASRVGPSDLRFVAGVRDRAWGAGMGSGHRSTSESTALTRAQVPSAPHFVKYFEAVLVEPYSSRSPDQAAPVRALAK